MAKTKDSTTFRPLTGDQRDKHAELVAAIRARLLSGQLAPGERLPRREELRRQFNVSHTTLQQAVNSLIADGFLEGRKRGGTVVAEHPPHLSRYGVVLPRAVDQPESWSRYWQALLWATLAYPQTPDRQVFPYYVSWDPTAEIDAGRAAAEADIAAGRVAGLVFANAVFGHLRTTPLVTAPGLPRVGVMEGDQHEPLDASVWFSYESLVVQALAWLAQLGCRSVATVGARLQPPGLESGLAAHGLSCPPEWRLPAVWHQRERVRPDVAKLFARPVVARPDALIVLDDNLLDDACAGLLELGLRVGHDVQVVSQWNLPNPLPRFLPVHYLAFDVREVLSLCIDRLVCLGGGETPPPYTEVRAVAIADNVTP